ncbi:serine hydrolase [Terrabacter sp. 2YAF2]|uniref:serine hydrolase domain-containing protein n=1 Tax=Terrabacter sp. 2YAF2 TaxID=3233026 RepID=UPI003F96CB9A
MPSDTILSDASPASLGLDPAPIAEAVARIHTYGEDTPDGHPLFAGAVGIMGHAGRIVGRDVSGWALRYSDATAELPRDEWVPMRTDTIFDLASVSKLFTSIAVAQLIEEGHVCLESPVAAHLPEFAANGKEAVTVRQLLTHTSGYPPELPLWSAWPDQASRIEAVLDHPLADPAGSTYRYSDLNLITLGVLVERLYGEPLDVVVRRRITAPLGMEDTGYNPADRSRTAATEYQTAPPRGMVRGEVHDENAWSLGGVAGHAGVFSTADDLAILSQALLDGGAYGGHRILDPSSVELLVTDFNQAFAGDSHGLGFELDQRWYMDALSGPRSAGHTGYTGTSVVIDFASRSFAILLTNRVHPSRDWGSVNIARRAWAHGLASALPIRPQEERTSWCAGSSDATTATLTTAPLAVDAGGARLGFDLLVDSGETGLHLERSTDAGTTWTPVAFAVKDRGTTSGTDETVAATVEDTIDGSGTRRWVEARAALEPGTQLLRWRLVPDANHPGRGVALDRIRVTGSQGVLLDAEHQPDALTSAGWQPTGRDAVA